MIRADNAYYSESGTKITEDEVDELANAIVSKFAQKNLSAGQADIILDRARGLLETCSQIVPRWT